MKNINFAAVEKQPEPTVLNVLKCKCPRCRKGDLFVESNPYKLSRTMKMYDACPVCKQPFELEVGFYYGSSYVSYAMSIAISAASIIAWWMLIGFSFSDNRFFYWLGFNALLLVALQPILMRVARSVWLAFFVRYDRDWEINAPAQPERINKDQMNNW